MKDAGWLDDVSEQIRRSMLSVELKAPEAIRFAEVTGDCFTSALFLDGVRIAALIAIKGAVTSRSALTIGDDAIVLNLQVEFKDS